MSGTRSPSDRFEDVTVSVVIPFNEEFTPPSMLEEAIETAENQVGVDVDVILVEDEDQRGPAWARNVGLDRAETRYVAFLDGDDLWEETKTVRQLRRMQESGAGMCVEGEKQYSTMEFVGALLRSDIFGLTSAILLDTEQVDVRFDESLPRREDHLFMIEAAVQAGVCFEPDTFTARKYEEGLSKHVDKSQEQAEAFFETVVDRVPEAERFEREYYQDCHVDIGRARHHDGEYVVALRHFLTSLSFGPNVKAIGAMALTLLAAAYDVPLRTGRNIVAR
jgi:hypothetical protein